MRKLIKTKTKKNVVQYIFNMASKKETILYATYKKWSFLPDFEVECEYCSEVEYNAFMCEAWTRNIKCFALKSVENFRNPVTCIHRPTLARHVVISRSFHNCCKSKVAPNETCCRKLHTYFFKKTKKKPL